VLPEALVAKLPKKERFVTAQLIKGQKAPLENFIKKLIEMGYSKQSLVANEGEFAVRGDILDVFAVGEDLPYRIDFFDDEVEQIYTFSVEDMTKIEVLDKINIFAATLFFRSNPYEMVDILQDYQKSLNLKGEQKLKLDQTFDAVVNATLKDANSLNLAFTICFDNDMNQNILNLFPEATLILDEPKKVLQIVDLVINSHNNNVFALIQEGALTPKHYEHLVNKDFNMQATAVTFASIESSTQVYIPQKATTFHTHTTSKYLLNYMSLIYDLKQFSLSKIKVVLFAGDSEAKQKLENFLIENGIAPSPSEFVETGEGIFVLDKDLAYSVHISETNTVLIGTHELVKKQTKLLSSKKKSVFYLPKVGEYVVHEFHGVGKCINVQRLRLANFEKDYFVLEYASGDKIYIPTEQANTISAFVGGDSNPSLNKLGGLEFAKVKQRAKKSIEELAVNLIELYKKREESKGFVFEKDSYLQEAFESAFEYEETPDQMQAIIEAKQDMMSSKIMDRLICGDVGYGKTEVALRCAYKAVLSGKQVVFLCPTTILAEQHYKTCVKRFKDFMVNCHHLNRLVPMAKQKQILKDLQQGKLDIIIGTHRLLAKDVEFKNLGLLVLDEEQRFGVQDKEKIKELKKNIDVLTLSATPIPRTLHMSLSGIRDISIIETAPKNRLPVQTYVCEYDEALLSSAISRELARGGQVFIVYNRVESIYDFKRQIQAMFADVAIGVAHGQMDRKGLEDAVLNLYNGQYQILIATTLIENGIDIPTANTLIVIDSDKLGLSSLYQLKGRVGRSNRMAYAYFTYKGGKVLTEQALARLQAITEFSSLGSGFKIAMRDLEIRGAGSVLGNKQHGHIEKVGYDLYCKILDETMKELRGEKQTQKKDIKMDINVDAFISENYIENENERIRQYTNISLISTLEEKQELVDNLTQAYGQVPQEVLNLVNIAIVKNICQSHDVKNVTINKDRCNIQIYKKEEILDEFFAKMLEKSNGKAVLKFEMLPIIELETKSKNLQDKLQNMLKFLTNA
jgi:transcription-repair coupling factor (superfamily II helicase)